MDFNAIIERKHKLYFDKIKKLEQNLNNVGFADK